MTTTPSLSLLRQTMFACLLFLACFVLSDPSNSLTESQISAIRDRLADSAKFSWEIGTRAQALLELDASTYSVFSSSYQATIASSPSSDDAIQVLAPVLTIAKSAIQARNSATPTTANGPRPLAPNDTSAADPCSLGIAVLLANYTGYGTTPNGAGFDYGEAATEQLDYLYTNISRTSDGALSHRVSELQLWSDFVYMVPPFLAAYGVMTNNRSIIADAYTQIRLYRDHLRERSGSSKGLWRHVQFGETIPPDDGHWSTGNAWAAQGILRTLSTIAHSPFSSSFRHELASLSSWAAEILNAMYPFLPSSSSMSPPLFQNYADRPAEEDGNFADAASSALLASTTYRLALTSRTYKHLPDAERIRLALISHDLDDDGVLSPVVDPRSYGMMLAPAQVSPEGEAFVLMMHAAWRDWVADGSKGANDALRRDVGGCAWAVIVVGLALGFVL